MLWIIVKFKNSEEIEAIPTSWYHKKTGIAWYPTKYESEPRGKAKITQAIINEEEPNPDTWETYEAILLRIKSY